MRKWNTDDRKISCTLQNSLDREENTSDYTSDCRLDQVNVIEENTKRKYVFFAQFSLFLLY